MTSDSADPLRFDFITDEAFRESLQSDYSELMACSAAGASKGVLVLCGSMVEAILVDYMQSTGQTKPDPLSMQLVDLIAAATKAGVLNQRTAELSSVIRSYRNLIHAGRVVRLSETYGTEDAQVAVHVLRIIVREVAKRQAQEFGLTAEQVATKFETDANAPAIAQLLIPEMQPHELKRLVLDVLPSRYFETFDGDWDDDEETEDALARLATLHRSAFNALDDSIKKAAVKKFVAVLREDVGQRVEIYGESFFRGSDLKYMTKTERELVIAHVLGRLASRQTAPDDLLRALQGITPYLTDDQLEKFVDGYVKVIAYDRSKDRHEVARETLFAEYFNHTSEAQDTLLRNRLDLWVESLRERHPEASERLAALRAEIGDEDDLPF